MQASQYQCAACKRELPRSEMKCYRVRRGSESHVVCFCRECHSAFEDEGRRPKRNPKVGRAVKGVVRALGAVGLVVMTAIFAISLFALKQIMKTSFGKEAGGDIGGLDEPSFQSSEQGFSFPRTLIGEEGGEPMLEDFKPNDLAGYEIADDSGQVFQTDSMIDELYREDYGEEPPSFSEETTFEEES